jgi:uncharacterized membrane protein
LFSLPFSLLFLASLPLHSFAAAEFTPINSMSIAYGVSGDGSVVVGEGGSQAALWTRDQGLQPIGNTPAYWQGYASDISRDGNQVLANYPCFTCMFGFVACPPSGQAIWTELIGLTFTQPFDTAVRAFAPNSQTLLGTYFGQPAYWTPGQGWTQLGVLPTIYNAHGIATASSADNSTIVGYCTDGSDNRTPFHWTAQDGIQPFDLPVGYTHGVAMAVSDDGTVVAGVLEGAVYGQVFRWTAAGGMDLLSYYSSTSLAMSADGSTIVWGASIWDAAHGVRSLQNVLQQAGADFSGYQLNLVNDISPDGRVFVGRVTTEGSSQLRGFVATLGNIPEPSTRATVLIAAIAAPLFRFRRRPMMGR